MYTAVLTFCKTLIVTQNVSIASLSMYRFTVLLVLEACRQSCCGRPFQDESMTTRGSPESNQFETPRNNNKQERSFLFKFALLQMVQALIATFAMLAVLVGIKTLPLSYVVICFNLTHIATTAIAELIKAKTSTDLHASFSLVFSFITVIFGIVSV